MENKNYEEEYSLLEIAKYNLKHWVILLICSIGCRNLRQVLMVIRIQSRVLSIMKNFSR